MAILKNLFIAYYKWFLRIKDSTPIFGSVCLLSISVILFCFLILIIFLKLFNSHILFGTESKFIYITIHLFIIFILYRYFKKERVEEIFIKFQKKSLPIKRIWYAIGIVGLFGQLFAIMILLKK